MISIYDITEIIDSVRIEKGNNLINSVCDLTQDGIRFGYSYDNYVNTSVFDYITQHLMSLGTHVFVVRNRCEDLLAELKELLIKEGHFSE